MSENIFKQVYNNQTFVNETFVIGNPESLNEILTWMKFCLIWSKIGSEFGKYFPWIRAEMSNAEKNLHTNRERRMYFFQIQA